MEDDDETSESSNVSTEKPSEAEKLQVKYLQLENRAKMLKDACDIRKNLLELRERESKDLIKKLQYFEEALNSEKENRKKLTTRMLEADSEYRKLSEKLSENMMALHQTRMCYEKRLRSLTMDFDQVAETLQQSEIQKHELENKILENSHAHKIQTDQFQSQILELQDERDALIEEIEALKHNLLKQADLEAKLMFELKKNAATEEELGRAMAKNHDSESAPDPDLVMKLQADLKMANTRNDSLLHKMSLLYNIVNETDEMDDFSRIKAIGNILRHSVEFFQGESLDSKICENLDDNISKSDISLDTQELMEKLYDMDRLQSPPISYHNESCYKTVDSDVGPTLVLSVSRTFIKLKDLILEKKEIQQEIKELKSLNKKMESKIDLKSRRLYHVSLELNKTWRLVSKLKAHHSQLRSFKSVQRYELQEKRRHLESLKRDLYSSRDKWMKARDQNMASQLEWESMRDEFARRRQEGCQSPAEESAFFEESSSTSVDVEDEEKIEKESLDGAVETRTTLEEDPLLTNGVTLDLAPESDPADSGMEYGIDPGSSTSLTYEEIINRRTLRLLELEEQCSILHNKLKKSTTRNTELASKLASLHSHYGSENSSEDSVAEEDNEHGLLMSEASGNSHYVPRSGTEFDREHEAEMDSDIKSQCEGRRYSEQESVELDDARAGELAENELVIFDTELRKHGLESSELLALSPAPIPGVEIVEEFPTSNSARPTRVDLAEVHGKTIKSGSRCEDPTNMTALLTRPSNPNDLVTAENISSSPSAEISNGAKGSTTKPSSLNLLSRIIIQQLPKLLDVRRREILELRTQASETGSIVMKKYQVELDEQKGLVNHLRPQIAALKNTEMELRAELDLKQRLIQELTTKIQIATENYETINTEHEQLSEYLKMKMQDTRIQEQRKLVKMRVMKNCFKCAKKFTLFKRKIHCSRCGYSFCGDCLQEPISFPTNPTRENRKKTLLCSSCFERKLKLDAVDEKNLCKNR